MSSESIDRANDGEAGNSPRSVVASLQHALRQPRNMLLPILSIADQAIVSGTSFATAVIVGRALSQHQLGAYYLVLSLVIGLTGLHDSVISSPYAIFRARRQAKELAEYGGSVWAHHWGLTAVSSLALLILALVLSRSTDAEGYAPAMWALFAAGPPLLLRDAIRFFAYAGMRVGTAVAVDAIVAGLQLAGLMLLWYTGHLSIPRVFIVMGSACLVGSLSSIFFQPRTSRLVRERIVKDWNENWSFAKWTLFSFLIGNTLPLVMPWLVSFAAGTAATGVFGACATLLGATNVIVLGTGNYLKPKAAIAYSSRGVVGLRRVLTAAALFFAAVFGAVGGAIWLSGDWLMVLVFGTSFSGTGFLLSVLAVNVLIGSLGLIVSYGLLALGLSRMNFMSDICWSVVTIVAALLLVFPYGAVGAAFALLIGTIATTAMRTTSLYLATRSHLSSPASTDGFGRQAEWHQFTPPGLPYNDALETA